MGIGLRFGSPVCWNTVTYPIGTLRGVSSQSVRHCWIGYGGSFGARKISPNWCGYGLLPNGGSVIGPLSRSALLEAGCFRPLGRSHAASRATGHRDWHDRLISGFAIIIYTCLTPFILGVNGQELGSLKCLCGRYIRFPMFFTPVYAPLLVYFLFVALPVSTPLALASLTATGTGGSASASFFVCSGSSSPP